MKQDLPGAVRQVWALRESAQLALVAAAPVSLSACGGVCFLLRSARRPLQRNGGGGAGNHAALLQWCMTR